MEFKQALSNYCAITFGGLWGGVFRDLTHFDFSNQETPEVCCHLLHWAKGR